MTVKISSREYQKLTLLVKDKLAETKKESETYEYYEELAEKLEQMAELVKQKEEEGPVKKEKKKWQCDACGKVTTITMAKRCNTCMQVDKVKQVT